MLNGVNICDLNGVEASTSEFPLIGYTVFWRLSGIRVSHPDLERALQAAGFEKYLPDPPTPRVALRLSASSGRFVTRPAILALLVISVRRANEAPPN